MIPRPAEHRLDVNGVGLCVFEWPGDGPPVLFVHATGFHARVWDRTIEALPGRLAYAVDMRGHGRSEKPRGPLDRAYDWARFGDDVLALVRRLDLRDVVGVGHSMGGHSLTWAAAHDPGRFAALLLVDPVIGAPGAYRAASSGRRRDTAGIARRRDRWTSPEEMIERFAGREPFSRWERAVLEDYCRHGLLPAPDGDGWVLACPPQVEAAIYEHAMSTDVHPLLNRVTCPVRVLRAAPDDGADGADGGHGGGTRERDGGGRNFASSPTWPGVAGAFPHGEDIVIEGATHFIPMESPALVAVHVRELIEGTGERAMGAAADA